MGKDRNRWVGSKTEQWIIEGDGFICIFRHTKKQDDLQRHTYITKRQCTSMLVPENNIPMCFKTLSALDSVLSEDKVH